MPLTYGSYLKIPELLSLQQPLSDGPEHDETLFIVIHQVYELWFKQMLHEGGYLRRALERGDQPVSGSTLRRMLTILKTMVAQIDVLETMTPVQFTSFRARLESSSGFQSWQFREFEFLLGAKRRSAVDHYEQGTPERAALERRWKEPTLYDSFLRFLASSGCAIPESVLSRDVTQPPQENAEVQAALIQIYRSMPAQRQICELFVDLDEGVQEWRYRHVKMVERTIGSRKGTGGSAGVEYLKSTLFRSAFPDLWAIRAEL